MPAKIGDFYRVRSKTTGRLYLQPWVDWNEDIAIYMAQYLEDKTGEEWAVEKMVWIDDEAFLPRPWDRVIIDELAYNPGPYENEALTRDGGWWTRRLDQIDRLTFHHTLSNSPHATASHYVDKGGGRPSIPYTVWVAETGEVLQCAPLTWGLWHDHTGHENTHLSVGLAGQLHKFHPPDVQLDAAARVAVWAINSRELPRIWDIEHVKGHMDFVQTQCPGWNSAATSRWKPELYARIADLLRDRDNGQRENTTGVDA